MKVTLTKWEEVKPYKTICRSPNMRVYFNFATNLHWKQLLLTAEFRNEWQRDILSKI